MSEQVDVLVVGAGPTGLTAACELARRGVRVRVVDAADEPFRGSRGKGVQPRTLELLDQLGVVDRLVARGRFRLPLRRYDGEGGYQDHDRSPGADPTPDTPYASSLIIPQWRVEEVLRERLAEYGVDVERSRRVGGLTQDDDGVSVAIDGGDSVEARYVIGADGGSSAVRRLLGAEFLGSTDEQVRMLIGDVTLDGLDRDHWHIFSSRQHPFLALCPLPATDTFQLQTAAPGVDEAPSIERFQEIVDTVVGRGVRIREASWLSAWRLNVRMVEHYRYRRVFLAGDAAHIHSPTGAQGMNTGIQDAINLGWKLAHVLQGADDALLDSYEAERLPVAAEVLGLSTRLLGRALEHRGADGERARQLGITYRDGPLARPGTGDGPRSGDRAPDAPCRYPDGTPVRLFELQRGSEWTLLGFGVRPEVSAEGVHTVGIGSDILDTEGHAGRAFAATEGELILIRPDGYIGLRSHRMAEITAYLPAHAPVTLASRASTRATGSTTPVL